MKTYSRIVYGDSTSITGSRWGAMVFDDAYAYVATPNGLYKTAQPVTPGSAFQLLGFQNKTIFDLLFHNNKLFVLKDSQWALGNATEHSILKSEDGGATFVPADNGLKYCDSEGYCIFSEATQALSRNNLIFINAGGIGQLASNDNGASWIPVTGNGIPVACGGEAFELVNTRLFAGGECPLDVAYLRGFSLRSDLLAVLPPDQQPPPPVLPALANRNVMAIKHKPSSPDIYAGIEGGLLKSSDNGQSFRYVIRYSNSGRYPYIHKIFVSSRIPNVVVVGGFDKALNRVFLAYSKDNGETWLEISNRVQSLIGERSFPETDNIYFVSEDPQGHILVGVNHPRTKTLFIIQLRVDVAALR